MGTSRSSTLVAVIALAVAAGVLPAAAHPVIDGTLHDFGEHVDYPMVFPVQGDNHYSDTFWASRSDGYHHATDIMAAKMTPVVSVAEGRVYSVNWSTNPNDLRPHKCCNLIIEHDDDWSSKYYHLNNDTPGTDDGQAWGIADGLIPGTRVAAGQLIGWVGDSTNAENTSPHLHFELVDPEGTIVNAYDSLRAAETGNPVTITSSNPPTSPACVAIGPDQASDLLEGTRLLKVGARGEDVRQLQQALAAGGFDPGPADGVFGSRTRAAIRAFQASQGLVADGVIGINTRRALVDLLESTQYAPVLDPEGPVLRPGARGDEVRKIQEILAEAGYDPGSIDGIYGALTAAAVSAFQNEQGIGVDGKVGPVTRGALAEHLGVNAGC
jgi:peptidoglycan hydrolase-like protein with peptidoglycan-binding domain